MSLQREITILQSVDLFSKFTFEQLNLITLTAKKINIAPDHEVFREGEDADCGYVVLDGAIDIFQKHNGENIFVATFETGSVLSELSLITENKRRVTAIAHSHSVLLSIPRSVVLRVLKESPQHAVWLKSRIEKSVTTLAHNIKHIPAKLNSIE